MIRFINQRQIGIVWAMLLFAVPLVKAQYYNPYMNPQAMQQAYEWGRRLAEQQMAQKDANDKKSVRGCIGRIVDYINADKLVDAEEWAENLRELNEGAGCYYLGLVNELQGYPSIAEDYYSDGVTARHVGCRQMLARLRSEGEMSEEQITNVRSYFLNMSRQAQQMANGIMPESFSSSAGSSVYKVSCPTCHGRKYVPSPSRYSASTNSYHWSGGSGCSYCNATYDHYHYRCNYCNADGTVTERR